MSYAELHACSAFSFLRGASFPEQLAERAAELELPAVALLDRNGVYGAQRFSVACREHGVRPIVGADLTMEDGSLMPVLVENRIGYANLCSLLTEAHLRSAVKGECAVRWDELSQFNEGLIPLLGSAHAPRAVCGASPQTSSRRILRKIASIPSVRTIRRGAGLSTRGACAPRNTAALPTVLRAR